MKASIREEQVKHKLEEDRNNSSDNKFNVDTNIGRLSKEIECPFKNECKRYPSVDCKVCAHNRNKEKRDYFRPDPSPVPMPRPYPDPNPDSWPRPWWQRRPYKTERA